MTEPLCLVTGAPGWLGSRLVEVLREIGAGHDRSPSQVALRWLIQQEGVLPIPGAKNASQATQNAGALTFTLDAAEVDALSQATKPGSLRR